MMQQLLLKYTSYNLCANTTLGVFFQPLNAGAEKSTTNVIINLIFCVATGVSTEVKQKI